MASRLLGAAVAALAVVLAAGCSGVPSGGPVHVVRRVPAEEEPPEPQVRRIVPHPRPDATPAEIVRDYLATQSDRQNGHATARRYLAGEVEWRPEARAIVYAARSFGAVEEDGGRATVQVRFSPTGTISAAGEFRARTQPVPVTFRLRLVEGVGWRLAEAPPGLLIDAGDVPTSFQRATLYWPGQAGRLAADPVLLPASDQPVAAIARALLAGPRGWLAPAVRTAIPKGTELLAPPELVDGVVTLNFSREIRTAPQETLRTLVAQVVWTLTERPEVEAVRLQAEGKPITVPGHSARDHRRAESDEHAPVPPTGDRRLFYVRNFVAYALDEGGRESRLAQTRPLAAVAVNRAGTALAAVTRPSGGRQSLIVVDLTGAEPPRVVVTADRVTAPTWEPAGDVVWAVQANGATQVAVAAPAAGGLFESVPLPASLPGPVSALRLSPDGARAALVAGSGAAAALWVARVDRPASGGRLLGDPLRVGVSVRGVTAAAFDGAGQLLFAARATARPLLYRVDVDGFRLEQQRDAGLPAAPVLALAVSAGTPPDRVASVGDRLWRRTPGAEWAALRPRGTMAAFAG